ncbi:SOS response-associated peptidase [Sanguibacter sp. A247]|uniref:SOS response-associated peptidase n=1 Tax=unclassified Sanguibacter TaxID=2645534 RepID=UPI003FD892EA
MCGRFASARQTQDLLDAFLIDPTLPLDAELQQWHASWNVAPTHTVRMVVEQPPREAPGAAPVRQLRTARWGLVPSWAKDPSGGARLLNARSETLLEKPSFKRAAAARRSVIPADGYYEWQRLGEGTKPAKQPYFIHPADNTVAALAGLYEFWRDTSLPDDDPGRWLVTCTVLTRAAGGPLAEIHDRTPVMLTDATIDGWLDPSTDAREALDLALSDAPALAWHPVSPRVGRVSEDDAMLVAEHA